MKAMEMHDIDRPFGMRDPFYKPLVEEIMDEMTPEFDDEFEDEFDMVGEVQDELMEMEETLLPEPAEEIEAEFEGEMEEEFLPILAAAAPLIGRAIKGIGSL